MPEASMTPTPEEMAAREIISASRARTFGMPDYYDDWMVKQIAAAIRQAEAAARADEREACAKFVEHYNDKYGDPDHNPDQPPEEIAAAIRARSTTDTGERNNG